MVTLKQWFAKLEKLADMMEDAGTVYDWKKPINPKSCLKHSTCIGYLSSAMQMADMLFHNGYIYLDKYGRLVGNAANYVQKHDDMFKIIKCGKTPQKLGDKLHPGDICLYTTHVQVFYGFKKGTKIPLWYSLEHKSGRRQVILTVRQTFPYYSYRKIDMIIRPLFAQDQSDTETKKKDKEEKKKTVTKYKFKQKMNIRNKPSITGKVIGSVPKGKVKTAWDKDGTWIKVKEDGKYGWVNASSKYATKEK